MADGAALVQPASEVIDARNRKHVSALARRRFFLVVLVAICLVLAFGAGALLGRTQSPLDAALHEQPPSPSLLTTTVTSEVVQSTVLGRGVVEAAAPVFVSVPPGGGGRTVLSATPVTAGFAVDSGQVLAEVSGRPVIVMRGSVTPYRDLSYEDSGTDVMQLQTALRELGYGASDSGFIDSRTCRAVRQVYADLNYKIPTGTETTGEQGSGSVPWYCQGLKIPIGEFWFVPELPQTLVSLQVPVGQVLDQAKPLATLSGQGLNLVVTLGTSLAATVATGMKVRIDTGPEAVFGQVAGIETDDSQNGVPAQSRVLVTAESGVTAEMLGVSLKVTIIRDETSDSVLAVPISAIFTSGDGSVFVIKRDDTDGQHRVAVSAGVVGDQTVEITPQFAGELGAGDQVVVGQ